MTNQDIINNSLPCFGGTCFLYYLINRNEIVYVGTTENLVARLGAHYSDGKVFERYTAVEINPAYRYEIEAIEIVKRVPAYNIIMPCTYAVEKLTRARSDRPNENFGNWCYFNGCIYHVAQFNGRRISFAHSGNSDVKFYKGRIEKVGFRNFQVNHKYKSDNYELSEQDFNIYQNFEQAKTAYLKRCIELIESVDFQIF